MAESSTRSSVSLEILPPALGSLLDLVDVPLWFGDTEGRCIYANPALEELVATPAAEFVGTGAPFLFWDWDSLDVIWGEFRNMLSGRAMEQGPQDLLLPFCRNAESFPAALRYDSFRGTDRRAVGHLAFITAAEAEDVAPSHVAERLGMARRYENAVRRITADLDALGRELFRGEDRVARELEQLTPREREVLDLFLGGQTMPRVAAQLSISLHTARNHLKRIFVKLRVGSQVELMRKFAGYALPDRE